MIVRIGKKGHLIGGERGLYRYEFAAESRKIFEFVFSNLPEA